jgi:hypothetical protein
VSQVCWWFVQWFFIVSESDCGVHTLYLPAEKTFDIVLLLWIGDDKSRSMLYSSWDYRVWIESRMSARYGLFLSHSCVSCTLPQKTAVDTPRFHKRDPRDRKNPWLREFDRTDAVYRSMWHARSSAVVPPTLAEGRKKDAFCHEAARRSGGWRVRIRRKPRT